jgi:hypothetical protein
MTNTIEPMDLIDIFCVEEEEGKVKVKAKLTLKEDNKLYLGKEEPIIKHIRKILPEKIIVGYEVCYINNSIYLTFAPNITSREAIVLLLKNKTIDKIKQVNWEFFFGEEWEKYRANFKNHIINKIINQ